MPTFLALTGMALVGWSLWEFRRLSRQSADGSGWRVREKELQRLADQLVATAQEVLEALDGRAQELKLLLEKADAAMSKVRRNERPPVANAVPVANEIPVVIAGEYPENREAPEGPSADTPDKYRQVLALGEQGLDPKEIAKRTNSTTGEVQLILGLKRIG